MRRETSIIINGESSSSSTLAAKYFLFTFQNKNVVVISKSRVASIFFSFSTTTSNNSNLTSSDFDSSFVVSYLINSCGLSENQAITVSGKLNFKTTPNPDSVLTSLKANGFTELQISKLIPRYPAILSSDPHKTLKPRFDFFISRGIHGVDLANIISMNPSILKQYFSKVIIPSFDILKSIVQSDQKVIKMIKRNYRILGSNQVKRVMLNLELLRNQGVPETNIRMGLSCQPRTYTESADRFKDIVEQVKEMGFHQLQTTFLTAIQGLASMTEANWRKKKDVYKRWGWSEDQIQTTFMKSPSCMMASEKKIMAVMNFLVNEMEYDSSIVAEKPIFFSYSLKGKIIPRCSVIRILVSRGMIKENIPISTLSRMVDESFLEKFVKKYEQEVPELMKIFQAISASKKLKFKTQIKPDSVLALLKAEGFTEPHISKLIPRHPAILSSNPHKTLKPKFDFFSNPKGFMDFTLPTSS
ncbi:hypothetical protein C5167_044942 [Papaver somniferum]|uniref:Uncharacterized protein n=1 Tax=Papaver somniferum TaxID=3469 RepID=A0A4Y7LD74_PAPSO|nr:hypothetical protein C5167_044942 [Papaver somniferum]